MEFKLKEKMKIKNIAERFMEYAENQGIQNHINSFNTIEVCNWLKQQPENNLNDFSTKLFTLEEVEIIAREAIEHQDCSVINEMFEEFWQSKLKEMK